MRPLSILVAGAVAIASLLVLGAVVSAAGDDAATADQHARRLSNEFVATPTDPPPDPVAYVNSLPYRFYDPEPAKTAWYTMTDVVLGWDQAKQDAWWPFAKDVMLGESGFCWNRLRGDVMAFPNDGCVQDRQGVHEDAGFGQITWVLYGPHSTLCQERGLCDRWAIIASPWNSMLAMIHVMDEEGSQPWCYNAAARRYHKCDRLAPDRTGR